MKHLDRILAALAILLLVPPASAVKIYQCEDAQGNRTFQDRCPPGTIVVTSKKYGTSSDPAQESEAADLGPVTLYVVPDCDSCDSVRDFLAARNIPVGEKDVNSDIEIQLELQEKVGGLKVPTLVVGDQVVTGFDRPALKQALAAAGYKPKED